MGRTPVINYIKDLLHTFITKRNISYLFINIGNIPIMTLVGSFLAIYYVDVLGIDEYSVGTMFLVARIFDGINDPVIGGFIDRARGEKLSQLKKFLIAGTLICSLNYLILWIGPAVVSGNAKIIVAYISYLLLGITFPVMDISLNSMIPVLSTSAADRDTLSSIKVIGYGAGTLLIEIPVPIIISFAGASKLSYIIITLAVVFVVIILSLSGTNGLNTPCEKRETKIANGEKNSFSAFIRVMEERNVLTVFLSGMCFYTGNAALAVSNTYYAAYCLGDMKFLAYMTAATYALEMFVILLVPIFTQKFGQKILFACALLTAGAGLMIRFIPWPGELAGFAALLVSSAIFGTGYGFVMILFYSIQACNVDCVFRNSKIEAEGTIAALMSMVNKIGKGIGGALPLYILGAMQVGGNVYSKLSLRIIDGLMPALLMITGAVIFMIGYKDECI